MPYLTPDWPAPTGVRAFVTLRQGGVSHGPFAYWNLAAHVGDDPVSVFRNRQLLRKHLHLPREPVWLQQVHGDRIIEADKFELSTPKADASFTSQSNIVCAVLTADCLPILLTDGKTVAAVHAGWRGILVGVIDNAITVPPWKTLPMAWLGPAIGPKAFEIGNEIQDAFLDRCEDFAPAFHLSGKRLHANIYQLAEIILKRLGVEAIFGGNYCTYKNPDDFFSYRRDGICGRMATLIWRSG